MAAMAKREGVSASRDMIRQQSPSKLGRKLRAIAVEISNSGERPLTRQGIEREIAERRGAVR